MRHARRAGLTGRGLGNGLQKFGYLPEDTTDFVFAVICEELGVAVSRDDVEVGRDAGPVARHDDERGLLPVHAGPFDDLVPEVEQLLRQQDVLHLRQVRAGPDVRL